MEIVVGIAALCGGLIVGWNVCQKSLTEPLRRLHRTQAIDRANYLMTLRRELANVLIWRNPQRYIDLYRRLHDEVRSLAAWRPEEIRKRHAELCEKYPNYVDFDYFGTREYVLYEDGLWLDDEEAEERYRDIVIFTALCATGDDDWKDGARYGHIRATSDKELEHLSKYVRRVEDTKLMLRLLRAADGYRLATRAGSFDSIDSATYSVRRLQTLGEDLRFGVHLKDTNEYGLYSFYVFDDGNITYSYSRSDSSFDAEEALHPIHSVVEGRSGGI